VPPSIGPVSAADVHEWDSEERFRVLLAIERTNGSSPAAVKLDFQHWLGTKGTFDESSVEIRPVGGGKSRVPHRVDRLFGSSQMTLSFVVESGVTNVAVYFDTIEARRGEPRRYHGLVGDGDRFCHEFGRREIAPSHFDCLVDFDHDGDLDLFKGGVEPFVYCYENTGANRFVDRGRLTSGGRVLKLPCSNDNRSWVTAAFHDVERDGDHDFIPSFGDGPDAGKFVLYKNSSSDHGGQLTFQRAGVLQTAAGNPLASGAQRGGWFPSITFVEDWDGDGRNGPDALVGSNHRCWLYRNVGGDSNGMPRFAEGVALQAGGEDIAIVNPRFEVADIDADGDLDLFAASQPGTVHWFENTGSRAQSVLAAGKVIAWSGRYLIGDAHSGVAIADSNRDGLPDLLSGRFWERADLNRRGAPRDFGGYFQNVGTYGRPRFERRKGDAPFTEQFQICDAVRQNSVRGTDWDGDGRLDLLAGDTDGFVWWFRNKRQGMFSLFAEPERLRADGKPLSVAATGGHARVDVCDWNNDGRMDLLVADGGGTLTLFLRDRKRALGHGEKLSAGGKPLQVGGRSSVLVCDWNNDGRKDAVLADEKGYYVCLNTGSGRVPELSAPQPIFFGAKNVTYVRPNLGSFADWDGDGRKDLIGCHFQNTIRFYRNTGSGAADEEPQFEDPEGIVILRGESPQMISGVDVLDWDRDGKLDILTGQGHGSSGLRLYTRPWIEDELRDQHPKVAVVRWEQH
jgi:hypothetical protein